MCLLHIIVLLVVGLRVSCVSDDDNHCPTWKWFHYSSQMCECGYGFKGAIKCTQENGTVYTRFDVCISWDNHSSDTLASFCRYKRSRASVTDRVFTQLPQDPSRLSYDQCDLQNREGLFCGRCKEGFAPSLHTFSGVCVNCSHCLQNPSVFLLFLVSEILPLTMFYLIIMGLRVNLTSGPIIGYIIFCQSHINYIHLHPNTWNFLLSQTWRQGAFWNQYVIFPLAGIWNLNFFSIFIHNICYSCDFDSLTVLLLQYLSVAYIFTLVFLSYLISRMDLKKKLSSVRFLRPILYSSIRWRRKWSASDSAMHSLATFTALLIVKVAAISIQLHSITKVYSINGTIVHDILTYEPLIQPSDVKYKIYAVAAYVPVIIFILIPAIFLCLYPNKHFQNLLRCCCGPRKRLALAIFVDTICSGYRDGLDGGRDWRRLFPVSLFILVGLHFIYINQHPELPETYLILSPVVFLPCSFFVTYFKPYKTNSINMSMSFHLIILSMCCLTLSLWIQDNYLNAYSLEMILTVCLTLPHIVMLLLLLKNTVQKFQIFRNFLKNIEYSFEKVRVKLQKFG